MDMRNVLGPAMLALPLVLAGCGGPREEMAANGEGAVAETAIAHEASYTEDGELIRPHNWREWIFVGHISGTTFRCSLENGVDCRDMGKKSKKN